jgi:hypothetical protein
MLTSTIAQSLSNIGKDHLVGLTKILNNDSNPGVVDLFMDSAKGRGHRIVTGHDLTDIPIVFEKFGMSGVGDYFVHLSKDIMSPDGIPFPFAKEIQEILGLSTLETINWLSLNIGDVVSGGTSIWHTRVTLIALQSGNLSQDIVLKILIGSGIKVFCSLNSPNPIGLVCSVVDLGALAYYAYPFYSKYVMSILQPEMTGTKMLENSAKFAGFGFATSFAFEGLNNIQKMLKSDIPLKDFITSITKKACIDGLISGSSSLVGDLSEKYLKITKPVKIAISGSTFISLKIALKKYQTKKTIENHDSIINFEMISNFA